MARRLPQLFERQRAARFLWRCTASVAAVAVVTGVVYVFRTSAPVLSLGVLYLFAVLPVAVLWGRAFSIPVALASMLAFNFFFLAPVHTFTLVDERNWFALAVYLVTAIVVSDLASRARRRAAEAEQREREETLLAELSIALLQGERSGHSSTASPTRRRRLSGSARRGSSSGRAANAPTPLRSSFARTGGWSARFTSTRRPTSLQLSGVASCRRSPRSSLWPSIARSSSARRSQPRRCVLATPSRRRSCGRQATISARL